MSSIKNIVLLDNLINRNEPLYILTAGYYEKLINHSIRREEDYTVDESIIIYCIHGKGWLESQGTRYDVTPGMMIFCDKGVPHAYGSDPQNPWEICWAHFNGPFSYYFTEESGLNGLACTFRLYNGTGVITHMNNMLDSLKDITNNINRLQAYSHLRLALLETLNQIGKSNDLPMPIVISDSIEYMTDNISSSIPLASFAKRVNLSKYHFVRLFKKHTGHTPVKYHTMLKIEKAKSLLIKTDMTVSEISIFLGYNTPFYFSESFKRLTGFAPRDYRNVHTIRY